MPDVSLKFPDGSVRGYDAAMTGAQLAELISNRLRRRRSPTRLTAQYAIFPILWDGPDSRNRDPRRSSCA